jgi:dTDP-4-amino-4,6-dideoxygalactose transaminase
MFDDIIPRTLVDYDKERLITNLIEVIESGQFVNGPKAKEFEQAVCDYTGAENCVSVNSGTSALIMAYKLCGAKKILTTPFTFSATSMAAKFLDIEVIYCDIDPQTLCMDMKEAERLCEQHKDIDAIVPVHIFGISADLDALAPIKEKYDLCVIDDCAQAFGAHNGDYHVGAHPVVDMGCYSLYPTKNLSCAGDGGFITCKDAYYEGLIRMRDNGRFPNKGVMGVAGNFRLSEFQASIAMYNILEFDLQQANRMKIAESYLEDLQNLQDEGIIELPYGYSNERCYGGKQGRNHTYHLFCVKLLKHDVKNIIGKMKDKGIGCTMAYGNLVSDYILGDDDSQREYPIAREITEKLIALPMSQFMTEDMGKAVVKAFINSLEGETQ